ncbi:ATP-binding cassette domain-containing protein [Ihubacter sp. rT4E-8]|uniref:ATP-binding cassette domain-containing protein n=1 Tax=Ihubacter sp. rT4E-8 TaxID=3242369 RepID=UPI003CEE8B01
MKQILSVENLKLSFRGSQGNVSALRGVSLQVNAGETLALVGESGCGKTALCRAVMMLHSQHAVIEDGRILLCGRNVSVMNEAELVKVRGRDAAMVFQDPMTSLNPTLSIGRQIMEPVLLHQRVSREEAKKEALRLLELVGIPQPDIRFGQYPHHFSGGMRQRAAIAIALAAKPKLLIADEPTTALDIDTQEKIMELLCSLSADAERAMIMVTHDLGLAEQIADRIAVMKDGCIVELGTTEEIFSTPRHAYTKELLRYARYGKGGSHYHGAIGDGCRRRAWIDGKLLPEGKTPDGHPLPEKESLLEITGLTKRFRLGKRKALTALNDFSLTVKRGEIVGVVGPSGCGKSTLARCVMGIYKPDGGWIRLSEGCRKQMIFQDSVSAFNPRMRIFDIIAEPLVIKKSYGSKARLSEKVYDLMEQVGLERELALRYPYDVSGGQRQRAAIARALITDPDLLVADEPIASLDVSIQSQIIHLLKKLHDERELTILLISHDLPMVEHISDRIVEM